MARYFIKIAEARWRRILDNLEGDELYDMAHRMSADLSSDPGIPTKGQIDLSHAYRNGVTDKRVVKAIVSAGSEESPSFMTTPVKNLSKRDLDYRKMLAKSRLKLTREGGTAKWYERFNERKSKEPVPDHWGSNHSIPVDPEREVKVMHGGGEKFIKKVLNGEIEGYRLENGPAKGIQVHPFLTELPNKGTMERTPFYANRGVRGYIDNPISLEGSIKAKFIHSADNLYEGGIPSENLKHLKNIVIKKLPPKGLPDTVKAIVERIGNLKR